MSTTPWTHKIAVLPEETAREIAEQIAAAGGDLKRVASDMGVRRGTLYGYIDQLGLQGQVEQARNGRAQFRLLEGR